MNQPAVAKLERRTDVYVSSLRSYTEAVGGRLKIVGEILEDGAAVTKFSGVGEAKDTPQELCTCRLVIGERA